MIRQVPFPGVVQPGGVSASAIAIPSNALFASVKFPGDLFRSVNDLGLKVCTPTGQLNSQSNSINLPGLTGKRERVAIGAPVAGSWQASISNTLGVGIGTQDYVGVLEVESRRNTRLWLTFPAWIKRYATTFIRALRTYTMWPIGSKFRSDFAELRVLTWRHR